MMKNRNSLKSMNQFIYYTIHDHSWMDDEDVRCRLEKIDLAESQILGKLKDISEGVAKFDFSYNDLNKMKAELTILKRQSPSSPKINQLSINIFDAQKSIENAPKDRSALLKQQLSELRDERRRLHEYAITVKH